ncbi:MAG: tetratricopeptide repeat protein [Steroidobacteraceae bacterium]|jgi:tetratricopeptide (TPR) repeat protein
MPIARNDRCPCGSGGKYKHCCGRSAPYPSRGLAAADAAAHVNLGNALARRGLLQEASASYGRALALDADLAEAHNNLGNVLLETGQREQALASYRHATAAKPGYAEAHENTGAVLLELGRIEEAIASYQRALEIRPASVDACHNLANALAARGRIDEAFVAYRRALALAPDSAELHNNLGSLLRSCGRLEEAIECFDRALVLAPRFAEAHANMGLAQRLQSRSAQARASCLRALELEPGFTPALSTLAESYADTGNFVDAERCFRQAIALDRDSAEAWAGITRLRRMTLQDADWLREARRIAALPLPPRKEACLRYAMGKYFDDVGEFEPAFDNFRRANELMKRIRPAYDPQTMTRSVQRIIESEGREWMGRGRCAPPGAGRSVFIVGMLRSGTTLAEQILASHPDVFGAGELPFWSAAAQTVRSAPDPPARALRLETQAVDYLRMLASQAPGARRVVDKMPANFLSIGLIHAALPNARIIHLRRHAVDTCLSIYFQHFEAALSYTNDLGDLARYYADYLRVMEHWRSVVPAEVILDVPYEALVHEPERWSRRMLEHIGLPWDPRCLDFHLTPRTVITASKWQVKQAITTAGVGRWRNYRAHLGALLGLLPPDSSPVRANVGD